MRASTLASLFTWALALGTGLEAQNALAPPRPSFCAFRTAPAPRCDRFLITEFAIHPRATIEGEGPASYLTWEAGLMINKGDDAWGGTFFVGVDGVAGTRVGIRGRYRHWIGPSSSVDAAAGLVFTRFDG